MEQCPICIDEILLAECRTKCNHKFHVACITKWLKINDNCPMCRKILSTFCSIGCCSKNYNEYHRAMSYILKT